MTRKDMTEYMDTLQAQIVAEQPPEDFSEPITVTLPPRVGRLLANYRWLFSDINAIPRNATNEEILIAAMLFVDVSASESQSPIAAVLETLGVARPSSTRRQTIEDIARCIALAMDVKPDDLTPREWEQIKISAYDVDTFPMRHTDKPAPTAEGTEPPAPEPVEPDEDI